jgi:hypothetical protein
LKISIKLHYDFEELDNRVRLSLGDQGEEIVGAEGLSLTRAYAIVVRYKTGGTFGDWEESGLVKIFARFEDALALHDRILDDYHDDPPSYRNRYFTKDSTFEQEVCHQFWKGYFESLLAVDIKPLRIIQD